MTYTIDFGPGFTGNIEAPNVYSADVAVKLDYVARKGDTIASLTLIAANQEVTPLLPITIGVELTKADVVRLGNTCIDILKAFTEDSADG